MCAWCVHMKQDHQSVYPRQEGSAALRKLREEERPYEKCASAGPGVLTEVELLAVVLRTGAEGISVIEMSRSLMDSFGAEGIAGLCSATGPELMKVRGIGRVKAMQLICIAELSRRIAKSVRGKTPYFSQPREVALYYMEDLRHRRQEMALVVMLDTRGRLLGDEVISSGTVNGTVIGVREIFISALNHRAVSIILIHNHPSGEPDPSPEDISLTQRVRDAGSVIGIPLLDHIIIGDRRAVSLAKLIRDPDAGRSAAEEIL